MSELRRDYLDDYVALVSPGRRELAGKCPYCRGSEDVAPPSPMVLRREEGGLLMRLEEEGSDRVTDWDLKIVPYHSPILSEEAQGPRELAVPFRRSDPGVGAHYVLVPTPDHGVRLSQLTADRLTLALYAIQEFGKELYQRRGINYVAVYYEDFGDGSHALIHVLGLPEVPPAVERENDAHRTHMKDMGTCPLCAIAEAERSGPRELLSNDLYMAIYPWAPLAPYEVWIIPRSHRLRFYRLTMPNLRALAEVLLPSMRALADVAHGYYAAFYTSSLKRSSMNMHWSIRLYGGSDSFGGLLSYGIRVLDESPEERARALAKRARSALTEVLMEGRA